MPPIHDTVLHPGWETILYAIPSIFMLIAIAFRLDELFASPRQRRRKHPPFSGTDEDGNTAFCDPDGRPFSPRRHAN